MKKDCCKDQDNLIPAETGKSNETCMVCTVCGCRHFAVTLEPGNFTVKQQ